MQFSAKQLFTSLQNVYIIDNWLSINQFIIARADCIHEGAILQLEYCNIVLAEQSRVKQRVPFLAEQLSYIEQRRVG